MFESANIIVFYRLGDEHKRIQGREKREEGFWVFSKDLLNILPRECAHLLFLFRFLSMFQLSLEGLTSADEQPSQGSKITGQRDDDDRLISRFPIENPITN